MQKINRIKVSEIQLHNAYVEVRAQVLLHFWSRLHLFNKNFHEYRVSRLLLKCGNFICYLFDYEPRTNFLFYFIACGLFRPKFIITIFFFCFII